MDWISGLTLEQISNKYRVSFSTAQREINDLLDGPPPIEIKPNKEAHLLVDGTYFKRESCLTVYFDNDLRYFQCCRYSRNENKDEIEKDIRALKRSGVNILSITADGKNAVKSALKKVFPDAKFQRCLVHIQRYAETYITQRPKTIAGAELRELASTINQIDSHLARMTFLARLEDWKRRHHNFLKERTTKEDGCGWWYTHRNLRRANYHIEHALPDMFNYLDDLKIPKDSNALEGRFADLKHKFRTHKGLKKSRKENYLKWYIFTKNLNKKR